MKMNTWYEFDTATPLLQFLAELKEFLAGKQLTEHYSKVTGHGSTGEPIALRFDNVVVVFYSQLISTMRIAVLPAEDFEKDPTLNYLYADTPYYEHYLRFVPDSPYEGLCVTDITLDRFSQAHEISAMTDAMRPDGGDYFSNITLKFTSGKEISVCGEDALMDGFMYIDCEDLPWNYNHWWKNTGEESESVLMETFNSFGLAGLPISEIWTSGSNRVRDRKADDNDGLYAEFGTDEPLCFCFSGTPRCLEIYVDGFEVSPSKYSMRSPNYPKIYHEQNRCWSYIFTDPILAPCLGKCIVGMEFADVYEKRWHDRCMILRLDDGTGISMCGHISMLVHLIDSDHHVIIRKGE